MKHCPPQSIDSQLMASPGGHPILVGDGEVIGGIGAGGAHSNTNDAVAKQALKAIAELLA